METKAIFLDVDGTLVSFDTHRVPQSAIEALQQVHESGIKIIIATGRAFTDLHELEEIPYDAVIALNGSDCVLRDGTPISRKQIPEKDFQMVLVLAQHYGFALAIETNKGIFVNELNPTVIELARLVNHPTPPVADIEKEFMGGECCQLCIYCDEEMEKEVMAQLSGLSLSLIHISEPTRLLSISYAVFCLNSGSWSFSQPVKAERISLILVSASCMASASRTLMSLPSLSCTVLVMSGTVLCSACFSRSFP